MILASERWYADSLLCAKATHPEAYGIDCGASRTLTPYEDLVERHALRPADGEGHDVGDVAWRDGPVEDILGGPLALGVCDVVGELCTDRAGLDDRDPDVGLQLHAQSL